MLNKALFGSLVTAALLSTMTGCGDTAATTATATIPAAVTNAVELAGTYSSDMNLTADKAYKINGTVKIASGATLRIAPGTVLFGATQKSYLAILPGAKIDANGTSTNPIIFTSLEEAIDNTKGAQGQWGGLSIFGNASTNKGTEAYEADATISFGKAVADANDTDSSGVLNYVIVRNSGYEVATDAELNGISLGGVGSGTVVENVASINGKDDAIEIWGGTVNLKNVYVYNPGDDGFDTDHGWRGTVENLYVKQVNNLSGDPRGFEWDSLSTSSAGTPVAKQQAKNFTVVTTTSSHEALRLREGTDANLTGGEIYYNGANSKYGINITDSAAAGTKATFSNVEIITDKTDVYLIKDTNTTTLPSGLTSRSVASGATGVIGSTIPNADRSGLSTTFTWMGTVPNLK